MYKIFIDLEMNPIDKKYKEIDHYSNYIKPEYNETITRKIHLLTGINNETLKEAVHIKDGIHSFLSWCEDICGKSNKKL
ncbi:MAG: hypothetical protein B6I17_02060 [Tenericutes bacterium 4572_104]|nr:MAG: hypothetical protein B6I17_02060 [Tenericutes bacterium 4572_104]